MSEPIFIHSLFRSGSTYLFKVFRRADDRYYCYQEPFNQYLENLNNKVDDLLEVDFEMQQTLRHPEISKPYFYEFIQIQESLTGLFNIDFCYQDYFIDLDDEGFKSQFHYIDTLIKKSPAIPVLQFCRTSGRIHALKNAFPGVHIHLWREPRNQWWSYNINGFFMAATQLIYSAKKVPDVLNEIRNIIELNSSISNGSDFYDQLKIAYSSPLDSRMSYLLFYGLWLYSFINLKTNTNFEINIDEIGINPSYRNETIEQLKKRNILNIHFDDCDSPYFIFSDNESGFFHDIEKEVQSIFIRSGYSPSDIDLATEKSKAIQKLQWENSHKKDFQIDAIKSRNTFISHLNDISSIVKPIFEQKLSQLEYNLSQLEHNLSQLEYSLSQLEQKLSQEVSRRNEAEMRARLAEQALSDVFQSRSWKITQPFRNLLIFSHRFTANNKAWLPLSPQSPPRLLLTKSLLRLRDWLIGFFRK